MKKYALAFYALFIVEAAGGVMQGLLGGSDAGPGSAPTEHELFIQEGTDPSGMLLSG